MTRKIKFRTWDMKTLKTLIKEAKLDYVNDNITVENFPPQEVSTDFELYRPNKIVSSKEVEEYAEEHNMRPANLYELLTYAKDGWNGEDYVVALGSSAVVSDSRSVPFLYGNDARRDLDLLWYGLVWLGCCRFLLVRKNLNSGTLSPSSSALGHLVATEDIKQGETITPDNSRTQKKCETCDGRGYL